MKMHFEEAESFRELFNLREAIRNQYVKQEKALIEKKEKLFKVGDLSKWGGAPGQSCFKDELEMANLRNTLMQNKNLAWW